MGIATFANNLGNEPIVSQGTIEKMIIMGKSCVFGELVRPMNLKSLPDLKLVEAALGRDVKECPSLI
jgi:hypothetical protein